ncbi:hypothetical protein CRG98_013299 [Punica granatum]|uniref:Uncharacterized protein n=1 Tax=Punica granatum TaxID=22663 RepID=A0A2I0KCS8_PUNGR|nr:hypothetical protein CRG98_013299 [Punica granatum]
MLYLASGYEERVGEVFESRVTRWSPWMDVRDVWMDDSERGRASNAWLGTRKDVRRAGTRARRTEQRAGGCAEQRAGGRAAGLTATIHPRARDELQSLKYT